MKVRRREATWIERKGGKSTPVDRGKSVERGTLWTGTGCLYPSAIRTTRMGEEQRTSSQRS